MDLRRAPVADFLDDRLLLAGVVVGFVISLKIFFCWRCISAVQKPRAAPAQVFAALSQTLIQGFFVIGISASWLFSE